MTDLSLMILFTLGLGASADANTSTVVELVSGRVHACALRADGEVHCWGDDSHGQLGAGASASAGEAVALGRPAVALAAGDYHTCALLDDDTLRCWGANHRGQLGLAHTEIIGDDETPAEVSVIDFGGLAALSVVAAANHTCALLEGGRVRCWGANDNGQLGYGDFEDVGDDESPEDKGDAPLDSPAIDVFTWPDHTCVEYENEDKSCVGMSWNGKLVFPK